jgi:iron complex outermembrane receptor protein
MVKFSSHLLAYLGVSCLGSLLVSFQACSQDNDNSAQQKEIEVITVTARRVEESILDIPVAISSISGEQLELRGADNVVDAARFAPNVHFEKSAMIGGVANSPTVFIRGIGQKDFVNTAEPGVGIYLDGVYIPRMVGSAFDLLDLERVEIMRGPQGTLYGRNTIGGAVNLISRKPVDHQELNFSASIGDDNLKLAKGVINIPLADNLYFRGSGHVREQDGYVKLKRYDDLHMGKVDVGGVRTALRWLPNDDISVDLALDYSEDNGNGAPLQAIRVVSTQTNEFDRPIPMSAAANLAQGENCSTIAGQTTNLNCIGPVQVTGDPFNQNLSFFDDDGNLIHPETDIDNWGVGLDISWHHQDFTLRSISAYRELNSKFLNGLSYGPVLVFQNNNQFYNNESWSQEVQLTGQAFNQQIDWLVGVFYADESGLEQVKILHAIANGVALTDDRLIDNQSLAVFSQASWQLNSQWALTAGLRWTDEQKEYSSDIGNGKRSGKQQIDDWTPYIAAAYTVSENTMVYTSYSEGFRSGGFNPRILASQDEPLQFDAEFVEAIEVGLKSRFWQDKVDFRLAVFETSYYDKQELGVPKDAVFPNNSQGIRNVGDATIKGAEIELFAHLNTQLSLDWSLGYLSAGWDRVKDDGIFGEGGVLITSDHDLPFIPKWSSNLGLSYDWELGGNGWLDYRIDWNFTDSQLFTVENFDSISQGAYSKLDARINYHSPDDIWGLTVGVKNLLDKQWATSGTLDADLHGLSILNVSRPRTFYINFRYQWF